MGAVTWRRIAELGLFALLAGCCSENAQTLPSASTDTSAGPQRPSSDDSKVELDFFEAASRCDVYHRGALLDLGAPAVDGQAGYSVLPPAEVVNITREGATWGRIEGRRLALRFLQAERANVFIEARVRGLGARQATVRIGGQVLGTLRFEREKVAVVSTGTSKDPLEPGLHEVTLDFHRTKRDASRVEIDWLRIGIPDQDPTTYAAPTLRDLTIETTIGGIPSKALALRAPGQLRCAVGIQSGTRLTGLIGYAGPGEGEAEIRLVESGKPPFLLHSAKVGGEDDARVPVDLPLDGYAGRPILLDFVVTRSTPGGRVLFGDMLLRSRPSALPPSSRARVVLVVVLTSAGRQQLPPYNDNANLPTLARTAREGVVFRQHRATTSTTAGSFASLLTGLPATVHTVADGGARLPARFATMATLARDGRAATGMFTGNPTTFEAFGFNRGWDRFEAFSPVSGTSARAPMRTAAAWLEQRLSDGTSSQLLAVVHAQAGHPPWAISADDLQKLPPEEYTGPIEARRSGQILAKERRRKPGRGTLKAQDRVRIDGYVAHALGQEDIALAEVLEVLRRHDVLESSLVVITSDLAMGGGSRIPFGDGERLGEDLLEIPLVIRFPGKRLAGQQVQSPTSAEDLARTVLGALQLDAPAAVEGRDLLEVATHPERFGIAMQFATLGPSYATRWGDLLLNGSSPQPPATCDLGAMDGCEQDVSERMPFLSAFLWRRTYDHYRQAERTFHPAPAREPATLDQDTVAALAVWGNLESK